MTFKTLRQVIRVRTGGGVQRCHGIKHLGSYKNSEHQWGVAMLMYQLWPADFPRLAIYCLAHDVPEAWVGDVPAPPKRYSPPVKSGLAEMEGTLFLWLDLPSDENLSPADKVKLKTCDLLELYLWAAEEVYGGNRHAACIMREVEAFVDEVPLPEEALAIFEEARQLSPNLEHRTDGVIRTILGVKAGDQND